MHVDRGSGIVTVEKLTLVVDVGTAVHPDSAQAQIEGAALWGLSMALHEGSEFVNGLPKDTNLDTFDGLQFACPRAVGLAPETGCRNVPNGAFFEPVASAAARSLSKEADAAA